MSRYSAAARDRAVMLAGLAWAVVMVVLLTAATSGCGGAQQVSGGAACSSLMLLIGERRDYTPERAQADIASVSEVCHRLAAPTASEVAP